MALATRAVVRIGLETARERASLACNVVIGDTGRNVPAANRYWRVAEALGVGAGARQATLFAPRRDREWARSLLDGLPRPIIAVHAGAIWETKRCPPALFADVLTLARARFGGTVVLVGTADDAPAAARIRSIVRKRPPIVTPAIHRYDSHAAVRIGNPGDDQLDLTGVTTIKQLAALLSGADVLLCNDSGPMHLAAAMGTPVVGLFTCTSPTLSGPSGGEHDLLTADVPCAGAYRKSCPWAGERQLCCHRAIPVDSVFGALSRTLDRAAHLQSARRGECLAGHAEIDVAASPERQPTINSVAAL
jgi:ADP-heptose:LPS heptosyltransferase